MGHKTGCYSNELARAIPENIKALEQFVDKHIWMTVGQSVNSKAFNQAFSFFRSSPTDDERGNYYRPSLFLSPRVEYPSIWSNVFSRRFTQVLSNFRFYVGKIWNYGKIQNTSVYGFPADKLILFVSDGRPTDSKDEILRVISNENAKLNNSVIIQTYGIGQNRG